MWPDNQWKIADESLDGRIISFLENCGLSVLSIARNYAGISVNEVIAIAGSRNGFIITEDKDFGDVLIYQSPDICVPALLLRLQQSPIQRRANLVFQVLQNHSVALLQSFSVLTPHKLRIRKFGTII